MFQNIQIFQGVYEGITKYRTERDIIIVTTDIELRFRDIINFDKTWWGKYGI